MLNLVHSHSAGDLPDGDMGIGTEQSFKCMLCTATPLTHHLSYYGPGCATLGTIPGAGLLRRLREKIWPPPLYYPIYMGWDRTNQWWQRPVWPKFDHSLQQLGAESGMAWRFDWTGGGKANEGLQGPGTARNDCQEPEFVASRD